MIEVASHHVAVPIVPLSAAIVSAVAITDQADYTNLTVKRWRFAVAQTPVVTIRQSAPQAGTIRLRVRVRDPRGEIAEEITPVVQLQAKSVNHVWLAGLAHEVTEIAFIATGMSVGATVEAGQVHDLQRATTATVHHHAPENWGFWIPGQRASRLDPGAYSAAELCDPNEPELRHIQVVNFTRKFTYEGLDGAATLGVSAAGWVAQDDKVGLDWSKIEDQSGLQTQYSVTDLCEIHLNAMIRALVSA